MKSTFGWCLFWSFISDLNLVFSTSSNILSSCRKRSIASESPGWQWPFPWPPCVCYWPSWWCFSSSWQHGRSVSQRARTAPAHRRWQAPGWRWAVSSKYHQRRGWSEAPHPRDVSELRVGENICSVVWIIHTNQWLILHLGKLLMLKPEKRTGKGHRLRETIHRLFVGESVVKGCSDPGCALEKLSLEDYLKITRGSCVLKKSPKACGY